jgi:hypothetical protein
MSSLRLKQKITIFKLAAFGCNEIILFDEQPSAETENHHFSNWRPSASTNNHYFLMAALG